MCLEVLAGWLAWSGARGRGEGCSPGGLPGGTNLDCIIEAAEDGGALSRHFLG